MSGAKHSPFNGPLINSLQGSAFRIPTASPESDGTLAWEATTLVLVEARAADKTGIGFSYADTATVKLINETLAGRASVRWRLPPSTMCWGT